MIFECVNLSKSYNNNEILKDINLNIESGKVLSILGESGCGKSTFLRLIAGLESIDEGEIYIEKKAVYGKNSSNLNREKIAMVFQDYALMPHLNARENILFSVPNLSKFEQEKRLDFFAKLLKIENLLKRYIYELSGGEQQRIAVARALIVQPKLILFDEPFSNLDSKLKESLRDELRVLIRNLNISAIFVTHDKQEAMALSDKIAIIKNAQIAQVGSPKELYEAPKSKFVASFMGDINFFSQNGENFGIRPENCIWSLQEYSSLKGEIVDIIYAGAYQILKVKLIENDQIFTLYSDTNLNFNIKDIGFITTDESKLIKFA